MCPRRSAGREGWWQGTGGAAGGQAWNNPAVGTSVSAATLRHQTSRLHHPGPCLSHFSEAVPAPLDASPTSELDGLRGTARGHLAGCTEPGPAWPLPSPCHLRTIPKRSQKGRRALSLARLEAASPPLQPGRRGASWGVQPRPLGGSETFYPKQQLCLQGPSSPVVSAASPWNRLSAQASIALSVPVTSAHGLASRPPQRAT